MCSWFSFFSTSCKSRIFQNITQQSRSKSESSLKLPLRMAFLSVFMGVLRAWNRPRLPLSSWRSLLMRGGPFWSNELLTLIELSLFFLIDWALRSKDIELTFNCYLLFIESNWSFVVITISCGLFAPKHVMISSLVSESLSSQTVPEKVYLVAAWFGWRLPWYYSW